MSQKENYQKLSEELVSAVGGKDNIVNVSHCMTRLRFNLKDESIAKKEEINKIKGVMGTVQSGGQLQVVIGQTVDKVYEKVCEVANIKGGEKINENLDKPKGKLTIKSFFNGILDGLAGSLTPLIPVILAAAIFKMMVSLLGPTMLKVLVPTSDLYVLFSFVGDAGFYFFPVFLGYTAAKKFGVTPVLGMFLGAILIHPSFLAIVTAGTKFTIYGLPVSLQNYTSSVLPIIVSVWIMSYVEKFFKKIIPSTFKTLFAPVLTIAVMLPVAFVIIGPAGSIVGQYLSGGLVSLGNLGGIPGILAIALIGALWEFLVMSGMHIVMITALLTVFFGTGHEAFVTPGAVAASLAVSGMCLGVALRLKKEERSLAMGYLLAAFVGGVTEPGLYGIGMRYKKPFLGLMIGGFAGGLYGAIMGVTAYTLVPVASFLALTAYIGGSTANLINGIISGVIAFVVAAGATYFLDFKRDAEAIKIAE